MEVTIAQGKFMDKSKQQYLSYLLRLWQTSDGQDVRWHASLEVPGSGERRGFASMDDLVDFLRSQTEVEPKSRKLF